MPVYEYKSECGKRRADFHPMGKAPWSLTDENGVEFHRDLVAEHCGHKHTPGNWPMHSQALGCTPDQIPAMTKAYAEAGVKVEFDSLGRLKLESRGHRNRVLELNGAHDRSAGYGDRAPNY